MTNLSITFFTPKMNCISCQAKGDILVKSVMFCNTCFTSKLIRKIRQTINTVKTNKIIIDCSTQKNYKAYITLILDACHYRHNKEIILMNNSDIESTKTISTEEFNMLNKDECALIKLYNIDDLAVRIFESVIKGQPQETVDLVCSSNIFYPFEKVSAMEIEHYCKINSIEIRNDENSSLTKQFIRNANDTNYSASFNIVETIRKGAMDRNNN